MFKRLIHLSGGTCVRIGRRILARLRPDPRLAEAAALLTASQDPLEAKVAAWQAAADAYREAQGARDTACRGLGDTLREFGFIALACTRNHHDADPYLKYFPNGYGDATRLGPVEVPDFVSAVRTKLAEETEPRILAYRERIEAALDAFTRAEAAFLTATRNRSEAFQLVAVEKRNWAQGMTRARAAAVAACFFEPAYIRDIFRPAAPRRRDGGVEEPDEPEAPEAPAAPGTPTASAAPAAPETPGSSEDRVLPAGGAAPREPAGSPGEAV